MHQIPFNQFFYSFNQNDLNTKHLQLVFCQSDITFGNNATYIETYTSSRYIMHFADPFCFVRSIFFVQSWHTRQPVANWFLLPQVVLRSKHNTHTSMCLMPANFPMTNDIVAVSSFVLYAVFFQVLISNCLLLCNLRSLMKAFRFTCPAFAFTIFLILVFTLYLDNVIIERGRRFFVECQYIVLVEYHKPVSIYI